MTFEWFWILQRGALADTSTLAALLDCLSPGPWPAWARYDLDAMGQWRTFDLERVAIDAQTQRTALIRVEGTDTQAMLALGKRGEPPTLIVRADVQPDDAETFWHASLAPLQHALVRSGLAPAEARQAFNTQARGMAQVAGVDLPCWRFAAQHDSLATIHTQLAALDVSMRIEGSLATLTLLPSIEASTSSMVTHWQALAEALEFR